MRIILLFTSAVIAASFLCSLVEAAFLNLPIVHAPNSRDILHIKENIAALARTGMTGIVQPRAWNKHVFIGQGNQGNKGHPF